MVFLFVAIFLQQLSHSIGHRLHQVRLTPLIILILADCLIFVVIFFCCWEITFFLDCITSDTVSHILSSHFVVETYCFVLDLLTGVVSDNKIRNYYHIFLVLVLLCYFGLAFRFGRNEFRNVAFGTWLASDRRNSPIVCGCGV